MSWTDCVDDGCQIHLSEKPGSGLYPQFTRRFREPSVAHNHDWRQEMEANSGEAWASQQPRQQRAGRAYHEIMSWEHCFNNKYNDDCWEKVEAGYYPRQVGEKGTLSKSDRREHKKRRAVRTLLEKEGSKKPVQTWKLWKGQSRTSEANSIGPRKSLSQKTTISKNSTRKSKSYNKPTIESNGECVKLEPRSGEKELSIVGPMQEGEGSNLTNGD